MEAIKRNQHLGVKAILLDRDQTAITESLRKVREEGMENCFSFICGTTTLLEKICIKFEPHIIELVGFLDYRTEEKAIRLIARIKECLPDDGIFLSSNIRKNREKIFLDWLLLWPMIYRNEKEFGDLTYQGWFFTRQDKYFLRTISDSRNCRL